MRIVLDAMGGDSGPKVNVKGAVMALQEIKNLEIILVGKQDLIEAELKKYKYNENKVSIVHTDEYIEMDEKESPALAVRKKKNASMNIALELVRDGKADACVSSGNTGALMTASLLKLGRIKGVQRPAITTILPTAEGHCVILDAGANADCKAEYIDQFATMGSLYATIIFDNQTPRVGLLNIGSEEGKGNELTNEAYGLLKNNTNINFIGNIEPKEIMRGKTDVIVTDGFTGNIVLKTAEGVASFMTGILKDGIKKSILGKIAAVLLYKTLKELKHRTDDSEYGGALFLGLEGISIKSHGSSDEFGIKNGIRVANSFAEKRFIEKLKEKFSNE